MLALGNSDTDRQHSQGSSLWGGCVVYVCTPSWHINGCFQVPTSDSVHLLFLTGSLFTCRSPTLVDGVDEEVRRLAIWGQQHLRRLACLVPYPVVNQTVFSFNEVHRIQHHCWKHTSASTFNFELTTYFMWQQLVAVWK